MFNNRLHPIPETRAEFRSNELPISQRDIRTLAQVYGEEIAENARFTAQIIRINGGVNPNTVRTVFPEGIEGPMDEEALFKVMASIAIWSEFE